MLRAVLAFILMLAFGGFAAAAPPLQAYGNLPAIEQVELSPDGQRLAYVGVQGEARRLIVQQLHGKTIASLGVGDHKVRGLQWAGPDHVIVLVSLTDSFPGSGGRAEQFNGIAVNLKTRGFATLLDADRSATGTRSGGRAGRVARLLLGAPVVGTFNGENLAYVRAYNLEGGTADLFRVDLDSGKPQLHERGTKHTSAMLVLPNGEVVARTEIENDDRRWRLLLKEAAGWREVQSVDGDRLELPSLVGLGRTGRTLLVNKLINGSYRYVEVAPDGTVSAPLDSESRRDSPLYDPHTRRPIGFTWLGEVREYQFFDPKLDTAWKSIKRGFPGQQVTIESASPDWSKLVIFVDAGQESGAYYLVDVASRKASEIGLAYPQVAPEQVGPRQYFTYKAADGLEIPAYLTLPPGRATAKNLPLVVLPHGGPEARDEPGFDWWSQALVSRGYAVLQPNYRGSSGYGKKFVEASYGQWGRKMQTDLSDGVRWLASQGTIDPKRVCIVGASYGGYAALAGATIDADVYRCAVSVAGVSDLPRMMREEAGVGGTVNNAVRYWSRSMGASLKEREKLGEVSPARLVSRAKGPILLIHGRDDTVVPYEQTTIMAEALRRAGKPYELVTLAGEDHWLSRGETRYRMLAETVRFLEKHNPPN